MRRRGFDREYLKISVYALLVITAAVFLEKTLSNLGAIADAAASALKAAISVTAPFIYALLISFFLNPFARLMRDRVFSDRLGDGVKRVASAFLALLFFISVIVITIAFILPELIVSLYALFMTLPDTLARVEAGVSRLFETAGQKYGFLSPEAIEKELEPFFAGFGSVTQLARKIVTGTLTFGKGVFDFLIGLVIAFYILVYKDGFKSYGAKLAFTFMKPGRAESFIKNCARINKVFEGFFVGKVIASLIVGLISFAVMSLLIKPNYILLSSVVIGVTNIIPFFGPFIGGIPIVLMNLFIDFKTGLVMALFLFLLQQFDGYILEPKILGDQTGLSPFWVIASILIGGAVMGIAGMLLSVPTFAAVKMFADEAVERKFIEKYGGAGQADEQSC